MIVKKLELYDAQIDFLEAQENYSMFIGGIGSGKTFAGVCKALKQTSKPKATVGMVVAPTYGMLRDSTLRTFEELAGDAILQYRKSENKAIMRGGHEIIFRSAEDPSKLRGPNLNWVWIDEAGLTRPPTWEICLGRLRAQGEFGKIWVTSTPSGRRHWLYKAAQNSIVIRASTLDNPNVSKEWKESLLREYTGKFLQQEVYAEFVSYEGLIYDMFDASLHVKTMDIANYTSFGLGIDYGYTNPAVILKVYEDNDQNYYVAQEWYHTGKLQSEIVEAAYQMSEAGKGEIRVDASAAGLIAELRNLNLPVKPSKGRVLDGIQTLQNLFSKGKIIIDPSCVNTIRDLESYVWKEGKDEPVKEFDHAPDALRYRITSNRQVQKTAEQVRW